MNWCSNIKLENELIRHSLQSEKKKVVLGIKRDLFYMSL